MFFFVGFIKIVRIEYYLPFFVHTVLPFSTYFMGKFFIWCNFKFLNFVAPNNFGTINVDFLVSFILKKIFIRLL